LTPREWDAGVWWDCKVLPDTPSYRIIIATTHDVPSGIDSRGVTRKCRKSNARRLNSGLAATSGATSKNWRPESMAMQELEHQWVGDSFFASANPRNAKITAVRTVLVQGKKADLQLVLEGTHKLSVWGANKNNLINMLGADDEQWIGKTIRISQTTIEGKKVRLIGVLL